MRGLPADRKPDKERYSAKAHSVVMAYSAQYRVAVVLGGAAGFESPNGQVRLLIVHGAKPPAYVADEFERSRSLS